MIIGYCVEKEDATKAEDLTKYITKVLNKKEYIIKATVNDSEIQTKLSYEKALDLVERYGLEAKPLVRNTYTL